jgi:hypothetical protein
MFTRFRIRVVIASILLGLAWSRPAAAGLVLSFDQSSYTIPGVGSTRAVEVFVSQTAGGQQVGPGNELLTAAVELSFPTSGAAIVASTADVTAGPAWDSSSVLMSTSGLNTLFDLGLTSVFGISDLSSPLLLGTFVFTGQSIGTTTAGVATLGPGPSFITVNGDELDPTDTPQARITVSGVTEPVALTLLSIGCFLTVGTAWLRRRPRSMAASRCVAE